MESSVANTQGVVPGVQNHVPPSVSNWTEGVGSAEVERDKASPIMNSSNGIAVSNPQPLPALSGQLVDPVSGLELPRGVGIIVRPGEKEQPKKKNEPWRSGESPVRKSGPKSDSYGRDKPKRGQGEHKEYKKKFLPNAEGKKERKYRPKDESDVESTDSREFKKEKRQWKQKKMNDSLVAEVIRTLAENAGNKDAEKEKEKEASEVEVVPEPTIDFHQFKDVVLYERQLIDWGLVKNLVASIFPLTIPLLLKALEKAPLLGHIFGWMSSSSVLMRRLTLLIKLLSVTASLGSLGILLYLAKKRNGPTFFARKEKCTIVDVYEDDDYSLSDQRQDLSALTPMKHRSTGLADVTVENGAQIESKIISLELFTQLTSAKVMRFDEPQDTVNARISTAVANLHSVNNDRSLTINGHLIPQETGVIAQKYSEIKVPRSLNSPWTQLVTQTEIGIGTAIESATGAYQTFPLLSQCLLGSTVIIVGTTIAYQSLSPWVQSLSEQHSPTQIIEILKRCWRVYVKGLALTPPKSMSVSLPNSFTLPLIGVKLTLPLSLQMKF